MRIHGVDGRCLLFGSVNHRLCQKAKKHSTTTAELKSWSNKHRKSLSVFKEAFLTLIGPIEILTVSVEKYGKKFNYSKIHSSKYNPKVNTDSTLNLKSKILSYFLKQIELRLEKLPTIESLLSIWSKFSGMRTKVIPSQYPLEIWCVISSNFAFTFLLFLTQISSFPSTLF